MRIEGSRIINDFIEPNKRQYSIPVYQRNYEWPEDQCKKLFEDIVQAYKQDRQHFCGSIVYAPLSTAGKIASYVIVDGQQRLTTIYLLLKALIDCAETNNEREALEETVFNRDKYNVYDIDTASKLKLKPIKSDNNQLSLLMMDKFDEIDKSSGIWINYIVFKQLIQELLEKEPDMTVKSIYKGIERLTCADIKLDESDNAQEIFERINGTGLALNLADKIRNFVLMTDADQEALYENYWLKIEQLVNKREMSEFFLDYLNLNLDGFAKESTAYDEFKKFVEAKKYTNEEILRELLHYAELYHIFMNGDSRFSSGVNKYLDGLRQLKQTTVHLFLFKVFDDYNYGHGIIPETELEKVLQMLLTYSIRRIMCEISSNSLRGLYKTLYNRVFSIEEHKEYYYDAIVSFMLQTTSRDAMPPVGDFTYALRNNNLYGKHSLCRYLLLSIENQGKEKISTDNLSIEHIMPQNKNLSTAWQRMLGDNWSEDRDRWLQTLGNLTLTGYNAELGDKPFPVKKKMIEENGAKAVILYKDVQDKEEWNANTIQERAIRLSRIVLDLFTYEEPEHVVTFSDPRYKEYTCANPKDATYKTVNYYELIGERVIVDTFANMMRSVTKKLYDLDGDIITRMARNEECFFGWQNPAFTYDKNRMHALAKIEGTDIYMMNGLSAADTIAFIKELLKKYDLDIETEFVYSARSNKSEKTE